MVLPETPVTLNPTEVADLNRRLSEMRHNVNNLLALIVAATELIRRKPDSASRFVENLAEQPERIIDEIQRFSTEFERTLHIDRS